MSKFFWQKTLKFGNVGKLIVTPSKVWRPINQNSNLPANRLSSFCRVLHFSPFLCGEIQSIAH